MKGLTVPKKRIELIVEDEQTFKNRIDKLASSGVSEALLVKLGNAKLAKCKLYDVGGKKQIREKWTIKGTADDDLIVYADNKALKTKYISTDTRGNDLVVVFEVTY